MGFDPFDPEVIENPYPHYARLREEAPCYEVSERGIWVISRYDDIVAALHDTRTFSSTQGVGYERRPVPMMIAYDPPEHTRLRRILSSAFTPRTVARLAPRIEKLVVDLLEPLIGAGPLDWIEHLALPLPVWVIAELMGIPAEKRADFKRWTSATVQALGGAVELSPEERRALEGVILECADYFRGVIDERRTEGLSGDSNDDLVSSLVRAHVDGERLTDAEIVSFCVLLLVGGTETTTHLIGNASLELMNDPSHWAEVETDPGLIPALIEESLRYDSPAQGFFRNTLRETRVSGTAIPRDAKVMLLYGSANRDPRHFEDPDRFRVRRHPRDHLAFGWGPHICLGAHLARLEAQTLARAVLSRVRRMRREGPFERTRNPMLRGIAQLPVSLHGR